MKLNKLEFSTKKKTVFSIAILNSEKFRESRNQTPEGRRLYNRELEIAKKKVKQYNIHLNKELPSRL